MAHVIHTIKNNQYLYEHHREGAKVICDYIGPVGPGGGVRAAKHGGGAPTTVTQQYNQTATGQTINTKRDISRVGHEASKETSIMKPDEKYQMQRSNGTWRDISAESANNEINNVVKRESTTKQKIVNQLATGKHISTGEDWYDEMRIAPDPQHEQARKETEISRYDELMKKGREFEQELDSN